MYVFRERFSYITCGDYVMLRLCSARVSELNSRGLPHTEVVWSRLEASSGDQSNHEGVCFSTNQRVVLPANQNATITSAFNNGTNHYSAEGSLSPAGHEQA